MYPSPRGDTGVSQAIFIVDRKLARIVAKLKPLSKQHGILKFLKNADHANTLNGFIQDLSYAVIDYQVPTINSIARFV